MLGLTSCRSGCDRSSHGRGKRTTRAAPTCPPSRLDERTARALSRLRHRARDRRATSSRRRRPPGQRVAQRLGPAPHRDPYSLYDIGILGSSDGKTVGRIGNRTLTVEKLAEIKGLPGPNLDDLAWRIYRARDRAWQWLLEWRALGRLARRAGLSRLTYLRGLFRRLPDPTTAELDAVQKKRRFSGLPAPDRLRAARSRWRWDRYLTRRAERVLGELDLMRFERLGFGSFTATVERPGAAAAWIDGAPLTERERRRLAGYDAEAARLAYFERLRDALRLLARSPRGGDAGVRPSPELYVRAPLAPRWVLDLPAPRLHGRGAAGSEVVLFHGIRGDVGARGIRLLHRLLRIDGPPLRIRVGESFRRWNLIDYRFALTLRCVDAGEKRDRLALGWASEKTPVTLETILRRAAAEGIPVPPLRRCLEADRFLPEIFETRRVGQRFGIPKDSPFLVVRGRVVDPRLPPARLTAEIRAALRLPPVSR